MFNKERFFEEFRPFYKSNTGKKSLAQSVSTDIEFLLDSFSADSHWKDVRNVAYAFATIARETGWTFKPIKEFRGKTLSANQRKYWPSGYYGRGYVQLTWDFNYKKATDKLGVDFVDNPDLALEPKNAFNILTLGMFEGWFTGKKLGDYITATSKDYKNARRIINGTDHAADIADYAVKFEKILRYALTTDADLASEDKPEEGAAVDPKVDVSEPIDNYPDNPKPGEPTPDEPAKKGEAVVGGRPSDPPKEIAKVEPTPTSGIGAWVANIRTQIASLGIGGLSLSSLSFFTNPLYIKIAIGFVATAIVVSVVVWLYTIHIKSREKMEREKFANDLTLKQLELAADPSKYNVKTVSTPSSEAQAEPENKEGQQV